MKRIYDMIICLLVNAKMTQKLAMHAVNLNTVIAADTRIG